MTVRDRVVVWGNCQAAPIADLLRSPLAAHGLHIEDVPPVYLATKADVRRVRELMRRCALLVSQPVSDEYRHAGCGTAQLAALLTADAQVIRFPVVYDTGAFPYQVHGYDAAGSRVDAPLTDYHDLHVLRAAAAGWSTEQALAWSPRPSAAALRRSAVRSMATLRAREAGLDVVAADLLRTPDAMWTMTHPANTVLATLAGRILARLGIAAEVIAPRREYLGQRRAAVDADTARALDWPDTTRRHWVIDGHQVPAADIVGEQLRFYAARPDVVAATLDRATERTAVLFGDEPAVAAG